jgi:hypothetical protein
MSDVARDGNPEPEANWPIVEAETRVIVRASSDQRRWTNTGVVWW